MAEIKQEHKQGWDMPRTIAEDHHDDGCYECCLHGEYAEDFEQPIAGLKLRCEVFVGLLGSTSPVVKRCKRSTIVTIEDPPSAQGWHQIGSGWVCPPCREEMDVRWERRELAALMA